jgi:CBS domain-containing protein
MLDYQAIDIFTSEEARYHGKPVHEAVLDYVQSLKIAARCLVTRGTDGCYENGDMVTRRLEILSYNLPVQIRIILPAAEAPRVLDKLKELITDGLVAVHELKVISHRAKNQFFPRRIRVRDAMTPSPARVAADTSAGEAARLLLSSVFTGLPVVDHQDRPVGLISQGDLISRGGMPLRLGLLAKSGQDRQEQVLAELTRYTARDIMTSPVIAIGEDLLLTEAVDLMLTKKVKRLPVTDPDGRLSGMLSRLDVFRVVMDQAPDWAAFSAQEIDVGPLKRVADVIRRDAHTVSPETSLAEVITVIDRNDIQRVAVVDDQGRLLGLIADFDLLRYFGEERKGLRGFLEKRGPLAKKAQTDHISLAGLQAATAGQVMNTSLTTVREDTLLEEAVRLMLEKSLKRLPVVDEQNHFKGMISRDSLLRTGYRGRDD